ncbi:hypothetical protein B296_00011578 [Ensete ventricosum]|uniref:Uncharacterized protein n=1 Tax=Ensete ventricosum TaxID=4639 RepID=A0A426ZXU1_ENSVE|nr:hypothetical protein B296_00011578 [Ensete ventricosum]
MQSSLMMVMEDHKTIGVAVVMVEMTMFVAEAVIMVVKVAMVANLVIRMRQVTMIPRHHHLCLPEAEVVAVVVVVVVVVAKPEEEAMIPDQVSRSRQFNNSLLSDEKNSKPRCVDREGVGVRRRPLCGSKQDGWGQLQKSTCSGRYALRGLATVAEQMARAIRPELAF